MFKLLLNYFTISRLILQLKNRRVSFLLFYDKKSRISTKSRIERFVIMRESEIGDFSYVGYSSNLNRVKIGKFCSISKFVNIGIGTHPINYLSTSPIFFNRNNATGFKWSEVDIYDGKPKQVDIGSDVWIGQNVTIMGGIKIGDGAIIGAHSVVTKDVPAYAIVAGVPAKIIKYRFDDYIIHKLTQLLWWNLPNKLLIQNIHLFQCNIDEEMIDKLLKIINNNTKFFDSKK